MSSPAALLKHPGPLFPAGGKGCIRLPAVPTTCFATALQLFCHSPGVDLRWGLSPEIPTHGAGGLPCTCLCMTEFPQEQIKAQGNPGRPELSRGSAEVSSCTEPPRCPIPHSPCVTFSFSRSASNQCRLAQPRWRPSRKSQTWPGASGFVAVGEARRPAKPRMAGAEKLLLPTTK